MRELTFGQTVEVRHEAIEFGAKPGALDGIGGAVTVVAQADLLSQEVEVKSGTDETRAAFGNFEEGSVILGQARDSRLI